MHDSTSTASETARTDKVERGVGASADLPHTDEIRHLLSIALAGADTNAIRTTEQCLLAIDNARRPFPTDIGLAHAELRRLDAVLRLICLIGHVNASAMPGLAGKETAQLYRDLADGVPVTAKRMARHRVLSGLALVDGGMPESGH